MVDTGYGGAFVEAIIAGPEDVTIPLVFADWLDENGSHDLAFAYRWAAKWGRRPIYCSLLRCWQWLFDNSNNFLAIETDCNVLPVALNTTSMNQGRYIHTRHDSFADAMLALSGGLADLRHLLCCK